MPHIFDVSELTGAIKETLEGEFPFVWVRGQVSGVSTPPSGHMYFTLKDERAQLSVVWFKGNRRAVDKGGVDPLTGEVMESGFTADLEDGQEVLVAGRMNVYPPRGAYQLVAEFVQEEGIGQLAIEFEAMKAKLAAKGYFADERKRELPRNPARVAVITAPGGAAIRDFLRIADERGWGAQIRIHPALVQGNKASGQIAKALDRVNADGWAQLVCLIRGGGSLEDLWAFNTEEVADAIFRSGLPVLSGVGHEVDVSIADFTADARAATPTHAAQMLWPERIRLMQDVDVLEAALARRAQEIIAARERELIALEKALEWLSPVRKMDRWLERFAATTRALGNAFSAFTLRRENEILGRAQRLRGAFGPTALRMREGEVDNLTRRLHRAATSQLDRQAQTLALTQSRLEGLDPKAPLARGYGLIELVKNGRYLRSVAEAAPGDALRIRVADGSVAAEVTGTDKDGS